MAAAFLILVFRNRRSIDMNNIKKKMNKIGGNLEMKTRRNQFNNNQQKEDKFSTK